MQGVGTVFQFTGVILFSVSMFVCCGSSLLSKQTAEHTRFDAIEWRSYTAQRAMTISLMTSIFFGLALAAIGLGLQAQNRLAPMLAVGLTLVAFTFWLLHTIFFAIVASAIALSALCGILAAVFAVLLILAVGALRELLHNPPPKGLEILPPDYKVPYSHMHDDPPEVRLARELDQRRQRLAVQQAELQMLEERLKRKMSERDEPAG